MTKTTEVEFFQTAGAEETLTAVKTQFLEDHPRMQLSDIISASFKAAYPGDREGRWVVIAVTHSVIELCTLSESQVSGLRLRP